MADKVQEYLRGFAAGLEAAQKLVKSDGIQALDKEVKLRGSGLNTSLTGRELDKAAEVIRDYTLDTVMILSVAAMHDAFGFGATRIRRWMDKFDEGADYLAGTDGGYSTWDDYIQGIREQTGIDIEWRYERDRKRGIYNGSRKKV